MKRKFDPSEDYLDDDEYDADDLDAEPEEDEIGPHAEDAILPDRPCPAPVEWKRIKVGEEVLIVGSNGTIRKFDSSFQMGDGWAVMGTPYRSHLVYFGHGETRELFVHDIVWRAFHGDPPKGWKVVHKYVRKGYYSNRLENLTIQPWNIYENPELFAN